MSLLIGYRPYFNFDFDISKYKYQVCILLKVAGGYQTHTQMSSRLLKSKRGMNL